MSDNTTFSLTSTQFIGEVMLAFDPMGFLVMYDSSRAQLTPQQISWLVDELPRRIEEVQRLLENSKTAKLIEFHQEVTFDMFWDRYDEKIRSSRKRALARWNKLSPADRVRAYRHITRYESHILPGTNKKYAETYLNAELWNN